MSKERSLFFPLALIAAGTLWILISMGRIPAENLWALAHFWPFLLIVAGIGLILRAYWAGSKILMDVLVVGGAVAAIVFAPQFGWTSPQWDLGVGFGFGGGERGSGEVVSETRELGTFDSISIPYPAEVIIQQGSSASVKFEADDNLLPQLSAEISAGTLSIKNKESRWNRRVNPSQPVQITITVKDLRELNFSSAGTVRVVGLEVDTLDLRISGAGRLTIENLSARSLDCRLSGAGSVDASGTTDNLTLNISGVGNFDGAELFSDTVDVRLSGVGSATVHAQEQLTARVSGVGSVRYLGNPQVDENVSGLGRVNKIDE